ncbi:MAG: secretin N-terminal domain-containing protein [Opitutales bacterium]
MNWKFGSALACCYAVCSLATAQTDNDAPAGSEGVTVQPVDTSEPQPVESVVTGDDVTAPATETEAGLEEDAPPAPLPILEMDPSGQMDFPAEGESIPTNIDSSDEVISVDFPQEDVRVIIRNVADLYGLNVVIPEMLQGSTSIKLANVTWQQVFDVVLDPLGYTYVEDGNIIKIKSQDQIDQEPPIISVFPIDYAEAGELVGAIRPLIDQQRGRVQVDQRTNSLIVTEQRSKMSEIQVIIDRLDIATRQVMIESKFIQVDDSSSRNLGLDWSSLGAYELINISNLNRSYFQDDTLTSSDIDDRMLTEEEDFSTADDFVSESELEVETTDEREFSRTINRTTSAVLSAGEFSLVLNLLQGKTDSRVVTNPTVVTLDNEQATIDIGIDYPIPDFQFNDDRGTFEVSGFTYEDIGVKLDVTPQVNNDGFIRLSLEPSISSLEDVISFGVAQAIPVIRRTKTTSVVSLKDGYTLAIGGLMTSDTANTVTGVPYLSDIPFLGRLFETQGKDYSESNLIIFITARTLNPDGTTYREIVDPRVLAKMGVTESEIPGYTIPEDQLEVMDEIDNLRDQADRAAGLAEAQRRLELMRQAEELRTQALIEQAAQETVAKEAQPEFREPFMRRR